MCSYYFIFFSILCYFICCYIIVVSIKDFPIFKLPKIVNRDNSKSIILNVKSQPVSTLTILIVVVSVFRRSQNATNIFGAHFKD